MNNNNNQNGGLLYIGETLQIVSHAAKGHGMEWYGDRKAVQEQITPYYINYYEKEQAIYYCNAQKKAALCRMKIEDAEEQIIIKEPIDLLQRKEDKLYFLNIDKKLIYCYSLKERELERVLDTNVNHFLVTKKGILFATDKGLFRCSDDGREKEKLVEGEMIRIVDSEDHIAFIDKGRDYQIGYFALSDQSVKYIEDSRSTSLNIFGEYIFYSNGKDKNHIFRYGIDSEFNLKFIPQPAEYLHVIDQTLYYLNQDHKAFMKVSVQGGKPMPLIEEA